MIIFQLLFCIIFLASGRDCQDYKVTPITTSSGLYYEKIGEVLLSNSNWQFVTSVDYNGYLLFYEYLVVQANKIQDFCQKVSLKECDSRYDTIRSNLLRIQERDESMANFLGITKKARSKRGFFSSIGNFFSKVGRGLVGAIGTIFGGGTTQVDLSGYNRQIGELRSGQRELQNELNQQRTLFLLDSERKNFQIEWLKKAQGDIENKVVDLEKTFQNDSEKKEKEIKDLKVMLNETQEKLKMQEEIQKKLVGQVDEIEKKLLKVDEDIKSINEKVANNTKKIDLIELKLKLNTISIDFGFLMNQFESEQKTLYDVIKNANKGDLDPYILTPLNLVEMLQGIQPNLPEDMKFPFYPNIENANKLYNVIKPSVYLYNSTVIFILQIPLVHSKTYNIHKVTSLPAPLGDKRFAFILPEEPFLLIDNNDQAYMLMSSTDFKDFCNEVGENKYLCRQIHQVSPAYASEECEVTLFRDPRGIPNSCNKRLMHLDKPVFLQLQQTKSWAYAVPETEILIFTCGNDKVAVQIQGAGFIEVFGDCTVRTSNFVLLSLLELSKHVDSNCSVNVNLADFIDTSLAESIKEKSTIRRQIILPFALEELYRISFSLTSERNVPGLTVGIILALFILALGVVGYLVYKKKIDVRKFGFWLRRMRDSSLGHQSRHDRQMSNLSTSDGETEKLKVSLKLNKDDKDIQRVSIREYPSTNDPEVEYLTVRVRVKKDPKGKMLNNKINEEKDINVRKNNITKYGNLSEHEVYLNELRKLKPQKNDPQLNDTIYECYKAQNVKKN